MMNLWRLQLFRELASLGSISAVAHSMDLTRPAVSQQLALLESEMGCALFERHARGVRLTPSGERLAAKASEIFNVVAEIESDLSAGTDVIGGEVRLAAAGSVGAGIVPFVFSEMRKHFPAVRLNFDEMDSINGLRAIARRQVDIAIVDEWVRNDPLAKTMEITPLCMDHFVAVLHQSHALAGQKTVSLTDLAADQWVMNRLAEPYHSTLVNACLSFGFTPNETSSCRNMLASLEMVRHGSMVSILPAMALANIVRSGLWIAKISPPLSRQLYAAVPKGVTRRNAIDATLDVIRQIAEEQSI